LGPSQKTLRFFGLLSTIPHFVTLLTQLAIQLFRHRWFSCAI